MITLKPSSKNQNFENIHYATRSLIASQWLKTVSDETGDDIK